MFGVIDGNLGRAEVGADDTFGRRCFFYFSDDDGIAGRDLGPQLRLVATQAGSRFRIGFHFAAQTGKVLVFFCRGDFLGLDGEDCIQDVGHVYFLCYGLVQLVGGTDGLRDMDELIEFGAVLA